MFSPSRGDVVRVRRSRADLSGQTKVCYFHELGTHTQEVLWLHVPMEKPWRRGTSHKESLPAVVIQYWNTHDKLNTTAKITMQTLKSVQATKVLKALSSGVTQHARYTGSKPGIYSPQKLLYFICYNTFLKYVFQHFHCSWGISVHIQMQLLMSKIPKNESLCMNQSKASDESNFPLIIWIHNLHYIVRKVTSNWITFYSNHPNNDYFSVI